MSDEGARAGEHNDQRGEKVARSSPESWDREYDRRGIPSSDRSQASSVVKWGLSNLIYLRTEPVREVLDAGSGAGRNARFINSQTGAAVTGLDYSSRAVAMAQQQTDPNLPIRFGVADLRVPLPLASGQYDLILDIFVYFHILEGDHRAQYREELRRTCKEDGALLISMATTADGYYGSCPTIGFQEGIQITWDPIAEVGNILPSDEQLRAEFADAFELAMTWTKVKNGMMHGRQHVRSTTALLLTQRR